MQFIANVLTAMENLTATLLADEGTRALATIGQEENKLLAGSEANNAIDNSPSLGVGAGLGGLDQLGVALD